MATNSHPLKAGLGGQESKSVRPKDTTVMRITTIWLDTNLVNIYQTISSGGGLAISRISGSYNP